MTKEHLRTLRLRLQSFAVVLSAETNPIARREIERRIRETEDELRAG